MAKVIDTSEPVHEWFGLTYSNYLVLPRSILQSMPLEWQKRFVACLQELDQAYEGLNDMPDNYMVRARERSRFICDPYADYERGRRRVSLKSHKVEDEDE
jgi:hypothetical protein